MSIYKKSVKLLFKEFVSELDIKKGDIIKRDRFFSWFEENYPEIKSETISIHFLIMSSNAPSRTHYDIDPHGKDDLLYQIDGQTFRLYDSINDPDPIYKENITESEEIFCEKELQSIHPNYDTCIEPGLKLYR